MCSVSAVGDHWRTNFPATFPNIMPDVSRAPASVIPPVTRQEFDELKLEMERLKKELELAKQEDIDNGEADCEMEDKVELIKRVAELVGVDLSEVFGDTGQTRGHNETRYTRTRNR